MTFYKVSELEDALLDAAVAKAEGWTWFRNKRDGLTVRRPDGSGFEAGNIFHPFDPETGKRVQPRSVESCVNAHGDLGYCTDWSQAGPIIERERIAINPHGSFWRANLRMEHGWDGMRAIVDGPTALIAAMRAYVTSKFGQEVELDA